MNEGNDPREQHDPADDVGSPKKLDAERGIPSVNTRSAGKRFNTVAGLIVLALIAGVMIWINLGTGKGGEDRPDAPNTEVRRALPPLKLDRDTPPPPPPSVKAGEQAPAGAPPAPTSTQPGEHKPTEAELLLERRKRAPILAYSGGSVGGGGNAAAAPGGQYGGTGIGGGEEDASASLGSSLEPTPTPMSVAGKLIDRNYLVTKGTFLDCALITAIDSTLPGMTACRLTRNIYSDNGKVLLLERGSIIEGEYAGAQMRPGIHRIFVLWTRVRTPKGVYVQLDSPGTDELGRSGLPGWVDTHFWKRFGAAMMLSLIDDTAEFYVARERAKSGGDQFSFDSGGAAAEDLAAITLKETINIRPTLHKNQGDLINVYVARDLDFRRVYQLRMGTSEAGMR